MILGNGAKWNLRKDYDVHTSKRSYRYLSFLLSFVS